MHTVGRNGSLSQPPSRSPLFPLCSRQRGPPVRLMKSSRNRLPTDVAIVSSRHTARGPAGAGVRWAAAENPTQQQLLAFLLHPLPGPHRQR